MKTKQSLKLACLSLAVLVAALLVGPTIFGKASTTSSSTATAGADLKIPKNEVSAKARFYPYKAGSTYMEVIAVKASDGSIRTALNTCQVCFNSGRGFYTQYGDELVCNNCGNRFQIDQVEVVRGGCNPVPITAENKTEDSKTITISGKFLTENKFFFARWKR